MPRAAAQKPKRPSTAPAKVASPPPRPPAPTLPPSGWLAHAVALATLAVLATVLYLPTLNGPFVFDDPNAISQSRLVRSLFPIGRFFSLSTRPFTDISYAINYAIGGLATWPYHLTNILLHAGNGLLLYGIAYATFSTRALAARYGSGRWVLAWSSAALFVVHPLASEGVGYVSSRSETLASFWILAALASYITAATVRGPRTRRAAAILLPVATVAALLSKETGYVVPFATLLYDWLFLSERRWSRLQDRMWLLGLAWLPFVIGGLGLLIRAFVSPSPMGDYAATAGLGFDRFKPWQYLLTQFGVLLYYLRLLVLPIGQTFDYDWPLAQTPLALGVVLPLAVLVAIAVLAVRARATQPLFTFAVGWSALVLAPTSSIIPIADLAVERRMYLPLAALALLAAGWMWDLVQRLPAAWRSRPAWTYAAVLALPLLALGALTFQRAQLWGDGIALHEDGVAKAPGNPRVRLNLAVTYLNLGQRDKAYETLQTAKTLYDRHESVQAFPRIGAFIQYNLGAVLYARKEFARAETELRRALQLGGQYLAIRPMAYMLLGHIAAKRGDWQAASNDMFEAIKYQDSAEWRIDLAEYLRSAGKGIEAGMMLQQTMEAYPNNQRAAAVAARWKAEEAQRGASPPK
jgi:protein O-mannosyl-transferase